MGHTSLKSVLQNISPVSSALMIGEVISISPVQIRAQNDEKLILSDTLRIPEHLTKQELSCSISGRNSSGTSISITDATITIDNSLKVGDIVHVLSTSDNKIYYVLGKAVS